VREVVDVRVAVEAPESVVHGAGERGFRCN
jgi:hypothetical protein